jgi:hypothetical protein
VNIPLTAASSYKRGALAALCAGARPDGDPDGRQSHRDSDITRAAQQVERRVAGTNTEDEDATAKHTEMNMTEGNKNKATQDTQPRYCSLRPELPHEIRLGFDEESSN